MHTFIHLLYIVYVVSPLAFLRAIWFFWPILISLHCICRKPRFFYMNRSIPRRTILRYKNAWWVPRRSACVVDEILIQPWVANTIIFTYYYWFPMVAPKHYFPKDRSFESPWLFIHKGMMNLNSRLIISENESSPVLWWHQTNILILWPPHGVYYLFSLWSSNLH